ncbi:unnamed protein product [Knipowitschia caucasica]|uniref:C-type lectin domain-containing protein n=1 Tax=Knipowitschia caucasica TaxID=637954 RepID=A0AAV2K2B1_KNICA
MLAPTDQSRDGMYSKLMDEEPQYDNFSPQLSVIPSVVRQGGSRSGPCPSPGPGLGFSPGLSLYRASTVALATLCVILLICVIAVSTHKQKDAASGDLTPQTEQQKQEFNMSDLMSTISKLREENKQLQERLNTPVGKPSTVPLTCPSDWLLFGDSCYFISKQIKSWSSSQTYCQSQGGHLAIVTSPEEQTFIWDRLPRGHWNVFWIGISDGHTEDEWKWVDGTPLDTGFWEEGEPNNHINEDCGNIVKTQVLSRVALRSWYDAPCDMSRYYVCEKTATGAH